MCPLKNIAVAQNGSLIIGIRFQQVYKLIQPSWITWTQLIEEKCSYGCTPSSVLLSSLNNGKGLPVVSFIYVIKSENFLTGITNTSQLGFLVLTFHIVTVLS